MNDFSDTLLAWFATHARDLPWRRTYDPYQVWISEIMLQQTQMERVLSYFDRWQRRFPDLAALAAADEEEVLRYWEGLGYYSRARKLLQAAKTVTTQEDGRLPADYDRLLALPGIGPYTAGAIMSIAFNRDYPVVDGNVERLFARVFDLDAPVKTKECRHFIRRKAAELLPPGKARRFNQGLMELGALVCLPKSPRCPECPFEGGCESRRLGIVAERPVPGAAARIIPIEVANGILTHQGRVFIQKRRAEGVWANLWEFPGGQVEPGEEPAATVAREFLEETELRVRPTARIAVIKHGYTRYRVTLHSFFCELADEDARPVLHAAQAWRWAAWEELAELAFPAAHRKLIDLLEQESPGPSRSA
jgi:A/G-specific adenine glycosylase